MDDRRQGSARGKVDGKGNSLTNAKSAGNDGIVERRSTDPPHSRRTRCESSSSPVARGRKRTSHAGDLPLCIPCPSARSGQLVPACTTFDSILLSRFPIPGHLPFRSGCRHITTSQIAGIPYWKPDEDGELWLQ